MSTSAISRRSFVQAAAASAVTAGAVAATASAAESSTKGDGQFDEEFDVVVVGAGIAGMAAAVTVATDGSGESVLLAEKGDVPGGNSQFAAGDSSWTTEPESYLTYLKALSGEHNTVPEGVLEAFADGLAKVKDWTVELGALEEEMQILPNGTPDDPACNDDVVWPELEGSFAHGMFTIGGIKRDEPDYKLKGASHIFLFFQDLLDKYSDTIEYRTGAAFEQLIQDADGTVLGAVINGKRVRATKGVILCCGGYENDPDLKENNLGNANILATAATLNTGDGHRACMKAGAKFYHMGGVGVWLQPRDLANTYFTTKVVGGPKVKRYGITVGGNGRRFYMDFDALNTNGGMPYLSDLKANVGVRYGHMNFGGEWPALTMPSTGGWFIFDADGLAAGAIPQDVSTDPVADKLAYSADTVEELAEQIGVDPAELAATVDEWNHFCEEGTDEAFHRPEDTLTPVKTAPFYAQLCMPTMLNTDGGPVRSAKGEILDAFDEPIPNLYSAGEFGSLWGHWYQGSGNIAECMIFGRIAARTCIGLSGFDGK